MVSVAEPDPFVAPALAAGIGTCKPIPLCGAGS